MGHKEDFYALYISCDVYLATHGQCYYMYDVTE